MNNTKARQWIVLTALCVAAYVVAIVLTQMGDPASETARQFQLTAGRVIVVGIPSIWIVGSLILLLRRSR